MKIEFATLIVMNTDKHTSNDTNSEKTNTPSITIPKEKWITANTLNHMNFSILNLIISN